MLGTSDVEWRTDPTSASEAAHQFLNCSNCASSTSLAANNHPNTHTMGHAAGLRAGTRYAYVEKLYCANATVTDAAAVSRGISRRRV